MTQDCPHGHGEMVHPTGDMLEPSDPYCATCGHVAGRGCDESCNYEGKGHIPPEETDG